MNKEQYWIKKHPVMWFLLQKISDFLWFFVKFSICMILWYIIDVWLCTYKLKEIGCDLEKWEKERGDR